MARAIDNNRKIDEFDIFLEFQEGSTSNRVTEPDFLIFRRVLRQFANPPQRPFAEVRIPKAIRQ